MKRMVFIAVCIMCAVLFLAGEGSGVTMDRADEAGTTEIIYGFEDFSPNQVTWQMLSYIYPGKAHLPFPGNLDETFNNVQ